MIGRSFELDEPPLVPVFRGEGFSAVGDSEPEALAPEGFRLPAPGLFPEEDPASPPAAFRAPVVLLDRGFLSVLGLAEPPDSARVLAALALVPRPESPEPVEPAPSFRRLDFLLGSINVFSQ